MDYILVVDDSKVARMLISKGMAAALPNLEIVEAASGEDGIASVMERGSAPSLSIIDYNMPGITGLEFAIWLEGEHPGAQKVLCTANIQEGLARRAAEVGVPVVPKPFGIDKLREVVELPN